VQVSTPFQSLPIRLISSQHLRKGGGGTVYSQRYIDNGEKEVEGEEEEEVEEEVEEENEAEEDVLESAESSTTIQTCVDQ
jgi:hypothetical protein